MPGFRKFDEYGTIIDQPEYYPFGGLRSGGDPPATTHLFTGHERDLGDSASGLDYMHARYYSFHTARFLSVDPVRGKIGNSQGWNRYTYALNNPMRFTDPFGLSVNMPEFTDEIEVTAEAPDDEPTSTLGPSPVWDEVAGDFAVLGRGTVGDWARLSSRRPRPNMVPAPSDGSYGTTEEHWSPWPQLEIGFSLPDHVSAMANVGSYIGVTFGFLLDQDGNWFLALGPNVGKSSTGVSGSLTGAQCENEPPRRFFSRFDKRGFDFVRNLGFGWAGGVSWSQPVRGPRSRESGLVTPQAGVSFVVLIPLGNWGLQWR